MKQTTLLKKDIRQVEQTHVWMKSGGHNTVCGVPTEAKLTTGMCEANVGLFCQVWANKTCVACVSNVELDRVKLIRHPPVVHVDDGNLLVACTWRACASVNLWTTRYGEEALTPGACGTVASFFFSY